MMMTTAPATRNTGTAGTPSASAAAESFLRKKKPRKPYTISKPRERWTAEEHDRFLHALLLFGREWKTVQQLVGTKTATQIRSHAQKFFLKARKLGLAAALPPPPPSRRAVLPLPQPQPPYPNAGAAWRHSVDCTAPCSVPAGGAARRPNHDEPFSEVPGSPSDGKAWFVADCLPQGAAAAVPLPLSPDDLRFAEVYRFVGDVFGSGRVEAQLQRLRGVEPLVAETILLVLGNLQENLCG